MGVNDDAFFLEKCAALEFIASKLAPTSYPQFFLSHDA
jgi:hypothetical protein